jgi:hypothetical protein
MSYYRRAYPWRLENRLYGALNEYAELNDVAAKNKFIYSQNMIGNCNPEYSPSLYSLPYYNRPSYYKPYMYGPGYGYNPLINPYLY